MVITMIVLALSLALVLQVVMLYRIRQEKRRMQSICSDLYEEYERVRGGEWAKNTLLQVVRDTVNRKDKRARV